MKEIWKMTTAELRRVVRTSRNEARVDEALDELDRREEEERDRDYTESDAAAAWSDRYEAFLNER